MKLTDVAQRSAETRLALALTRRCAIAVHARLRAERDAAVSQAVLDEALAALSNRSHLLQHLRLVHLPQLQLSLPATRRDLRAPHHLALLVRLHLRHHNRHVVVVDPLANIWTLQLIADDRHRILGQCMLTQRCQQKNHRNRQLPHRVTSDLNVNCFSRRRTLDF